jgi:hypothetical protein
VLERTKFNQSRPITLLSSDPESAQIGDVEARRSSEISNQHRLLGEDTRHRALP